MNVYYSLVTWTAALTEFHVAATECLPTALLHCHFLRPFLTLHGTQPRRASPGIGVNSQLLLPDVNTYMMYVDLHLLSCFPKTRNVRQLAFVGKTLLLFQVDFRG